jgi:hypothetical protein
MGSKLDKWTGVACAALIVGALLACKKKEEPPPPVATAAPEPEPVEEPKKEPPKKEKVKRYGDKEQDESGTVRVIVHHLKVFGEADETTDHIATLSYGTLVNRKARMGNWMLIDWPSGVGELSPGWVLNRQIAKKVEQVKAEDVAKQDAGAIVVEAPKEQKVDAAVAVAPTVDAAAAPTATATVATAPDASVLKIPKLKLPPKPQ